jgi:integrase
MASIQKHGDKWRAQVYKAGVRRSAVFDSKRAASDWAERVSAELGQGGKRGRQTFGQAVDLYLSTASASKRSTDWESRRMAAFREHFGDKTPLVKIDSARIGKWRDFRMSGTPDSQAVSGSTIQREANLLRNLFTRAVDEWRWIDRNPFKGVWLPKENDARHQVWAWQLVKRVLRAPRAGKTAEVQLAFRIALHTALRLSEVLSGVYHPQRRVMELEKTKTGGRVLVPIPRRAAKLLPAKFTVGPNEASTLFSKLCRELLIDGLTFHDTRATALTLLSRRVDVMTLARISRHKDIALLHRVYYRETAEQIASRL